MEFMLNGTNENVIKRKQARNHEFMTGWTSFLFGGGVKAVRCNIMSTFELETF